MLYSILNFIATFLLILFLTEAFVFTAGFVIKTLFDPIWMDNVLDSLDMWDTEWLDKFFATFLATAMLFIFTIIPLCICAGNEHEPEKYNVELNNDTNTVTITNDNGKTYIITLPQEN